MAADWSQLPKDLLQLISSKLDSEFYQLRFRSVCSAWRSSVPRNHHHNLLLLLNLPSKFQIPSESNFTPNNRIFKNYFLLSKRSLFLITPPLNQHNQTLNHPWLIKIGPDSRGRTRLWNPLSRDDQLSLHFPQLIDFNHYRVIHLGCEFVIGNFPSNSSQKFSLSLNSILMKKIVVYHTLHCSALLTIHVSGKLAIFRSGDERWTIIPEMSSPYTDVCVFNGRPIAVDSTGRTVAVGPDLSLDLVAEALFGGDKKLLVESDGELLLVDKYMSCIAKYNLDADGELLLVDKNSVPGDRTYEIKIEKDMRLEVFRLDEKEKKWVEVRNLGDRVLFLGEDCAFSASTSDLCSGNGNCVIHRGDLCRFAHYTGLGIAVFCLEERDILPLSDRYPKLFWPPPEWVGLH